MWFRLMVVFFLNLAFSVLNTFAQTDSKPDSTTWDTMNVVLQHSNLEDTIKKEIFRKNIIKVNLSAFALYNNSISYERSLSRKISFVAEYRYMPRIRPTSAFLVKKALNRYGNGNTDFEDKLNSVMVGNTAYTGEFRFYGGKKPGARGFYLSLYGRYMNLTTIHNYEYETDKFIYNIPFNGTMKGFAGGAMIGAQWLIAKRVTFDWYILGGHYGKLRVDVPGKMDLSTISSDERKGLKEDVESLFSVLGELSDVEATVSEQGVDLKGSMPFVGLRGLSFSLGIAF